MYSRHEADSHTKCVDIEGNTLDCTRCVMLDNCKYWKQVKLDLEVEFYMSKHFSKAELEKIINW